MLNERPIPGKTIRECFAELKSNLELSFMQIDGSTVLVIFFRYPVFDEFARFEMS